MFRYTVLSCWGLDNAAERRSSLPMRLEDRLATRQTEDLSTHPRLAVAAEERCAQFFKNEYVQGGWLAGLIAQLQVRYPTVPIVFCETRPLAEEWTLRLLGAALAHHLDEPGDPTAPREWRD